MESRMRLITPIFAVCCYMITFSPLSLGENKQEERMPFEPPFTLADIENVFINNLMEKRDNVKVDLQHYHAIYKGLKASMYPTSGEEYECEPTRKVVIHLKNGIKYSIIYHVECNAPEVFFRESEEGKEVRLFNLHLKKTLMALELSHFKIRFVRMQRPIDNDMAVISSTTENVHFDGITSSLNDGEGQHYEVEGELTKDGRIKLSITVTNQRQMDGDRTNKKKAEVKKTLLFGQEDLKTEGSAHVLSVPPDEFLIIICEPQLP